MTEVLKESELHERRAFVETLVKETVSCPARQWSATPSPFLNRHEKLRYSWAVDLDEMADSGA